MRTTIDKAGRIVIPKAIRESLGLTGEVDLEVDGTAVRIEAVIDDDRLEERGGRLVIPATGVPITDDDVRRVLDGLRDRSIR